MVDRKLFAYVLKDQFTKVICAKPKTSKRIIYIGLSNMDATSELSYMEAML